MNGLKRKSMAPQDFRARSAVSAGAGAGGEGGAAGGGDGFQLREERERGRVKDLAAEIFDDELIVGVEKMVFFRPTVNKKEDPEGYIKELVKQIKSVFGDS